MAKTRGIYAPTPVASIEQRWLTRLVQVSNSADSPFGDERKPLTKTVLCDFFVGAGPSSPDDDSY
jgi:hypothetical protein